MTTLPQLTDARFAEIALLYHEWRMRHFGSANYLRELKLASEFLKIPEDEMFAFSVGVVERLGNAHLHNDNIPVSALVSNASMHGTIAGALATVVKTGTFKHVEIIRGAARSGRLLLLEPFARSVPLPEPFTAHKAAAELVRLAKEEARYDPPVHGDSRYVKGWEIRKAILDGVPAALVWATWVDGRTL